MSTRYWGTPTEGEVGVTYDVRCRVCGEVVAHLKMWPEPNADIYLDDIAPPGAVHVECVKKEQRQSKS